MSKKYKTDKWYTSPWNFLEEISNQFNFAENIRLHDVSLRDGEQQAGLIFNKEQKIEIADRLMEIGVHRIEAGMPAVSKQDEAAIREIVKRSENTNTEVFAFARCMKEDVELAADCGVKGIVVEIPSSEHIIQNAYNWPLKRAVEASIEATKLAKELGLYTVFFPIDMTRADIDWVLDLVEDVATNGHMDALALVDTFGGISPHAVPYLVRKAKQRINKPMEAHFHDDFGLGTANTIMALAAGVEVAHTTIMGIGERAGNVSFEELALSLLTMYDVNLGLKTEKFYELDKFVKDISGLKMKQNKGIFGENIFDIESGIVTGWYVNARKNHPLELSPYLPELTGHNNTRIVIGKHSGLPSIEVWLEIIGVDATSEQKAEILAKIKEKAYEKETTLTKEEFVEIVNNVVL